MSTLDKLADDLADLYQRLQLGLTPFAAAGGESRHTKPGSRPPLRIEVSDLIGEIDRLAHDGIADLRSALGHNQRRESTTRALRAIPALLAAIPTSSDLLAHRIRQRLEQALIDGYSVLGLGPTRIGLGRCPYCQQQNALVADPHDVVAWCRNRACGYACGADDCWCDENDPNRLHRYRWPREHLVKLALMLEAPA